MLRVGVIGYGYWGPNLVRNFMEVDGATVTAICDARPERLTRAHARWPTARCTTLVDELLHAKDIDAVAIATPISSHFDLAMRALAESKHVLVEKPIAASVEQTQRLVDEADRRNLVLQVDHTFVYTGSVRKMRDLVRSGELGKIYYYDAVRVNLGLFQHDVNVVWDLAVHDLSIMDYVLAAPPRAISAFAVSHIAGQPANLAYITVFFDDNVVAHVNVNWLAPAKVRQTLIGGSERMVVYNDLEPSEKLKVYDRGVDLLHQTDSIHEHLVSYRTGDVWIPHIDHTEALRVEAQHFIECVEQRATPLTDGRAGLRIVRLLEAAERSVAERGRLIELTDSDSAHG